MLGLTIAILLSGPPVLPDQTDQAVPVESVQRPDQNNQSKFHFERGTAFFQAADYNAAVYEFTKSIQFTDDLTIKGVLNLNIAVARQEQFRIDHQILHLQKAKAIYERFIYQSEQGYPYSIQDVADAKEGLAKVEAQLRVHSQIQRNKEAPHESKLVPPPPPVVNDDGGGGLDRPKVLGISLLSAGGVFLASGVGVLVYGSLYKGKARRQVDELTGGDPSHPLAAQGNEYIETSVKQGRTVMGIGGAVLAVGVAGVVAGALQVRKSTKVTPSVGPGFAGVQITGRF